MILGGGFGGLTAARELRKGLAADNTVTIVDKSPLFVMDVIKLWILDGRLPVGGSSGNRTKLRQKGIDFIEGEVESISADSRTVEVGKRKLEFDYLIIALGADYVEAATPGFSQNALNLYTESGCTQIRDELSTLDSGSVTIAICGLPFKCPPAPYEAAFLIDDILRRRGVRDHVSMRIVTPEPHPLTILGAQAGDLVTGMLTERRIEYYPTQKVKEIRPGAVLMDDGKQFSQKLLVAIPVHTAPNVVKKAGLIDQSGWIPVNPRTLATKHHSIYAAGDCAGARIPKGQLLPRAGSLAEEQGRIVAANIIHEILGESRREEFDGHGACFMETGKGEAAPVQTNFYAEPAPTWQFTKPSREGMIGKQKFLNDRMIAWFG